MLLSLSSAEPHGPAGGCKGPSPGPGPGPPPEDHGPGCQPTGDQLSPLFYFDVSDLFSRLG